MGSIVVSSLDFPILAPSVINPAFLALSELFSYAYFAAGNINVGFTPLWKERHVTCRRDASRSGSSQRSP
jgi:hypothetical protein